MVFPTTHWSLLAQASLNGDTAGRQALEELCLQYWKPLREFVRARGYMEMDAQDVTQDFIVHLLEHSTFKKADRFRGRFRSFLLGSLVRFLADEYDRRHALKRGQGAAHLSLDLAQAELAGPSQQSTRAFDREWAVVILERVLQVLHQEHEAGGANRFKVLRGFLPGSSEVVSYDAAANQLGMSLSAFKSEVHRLRQRFKAMVRQEVIATVAAPHEIEEELEYLQQVLMDTGTDPGAGTKPFVSPS
jgi:RNA polymerase sigma-70 factor (ECF subfamily)